MPAPAATDELAHLRLAAEISGVDVPEFVAPGDGHAVLGGLRLHYVDWGRADAPPILFLHGGGQTARTWDLCCLALRPDYRCLALDLRGHGDSEWSYAFDYGIDAFAGDVAGLADHLGLGRFVLVGMSLGCFTALAYATRQPDRLAGLVAVDAGPGVTLQDGQHIIDFVEGHKNLPTVEDYVNAAMRFNPLRDPRLLRRSLLHNLRQLPDGSWTWKSDRRGGFGVGRLLDQMGPVWASLDRIACPTLVLHGEHSRVYTPALAADLAARVQNGRWVTVPDCGHTVQGDNPAGLLGALRPFLRHCT